MAVSSREIGLLKVSITENSGTQFGFDETGEQQTARSRIDRSRVAPDVAPSVSAESILYFIYDPRS